MDARTEKLNVDRLSEVAAVDMRELKGLEIAARAKIVFDGTAWQVPSQSGNGKYRVTLKPESCACDDWSLRQQPCKHIHAVRIVRERDGGEMAPAMDTDVVPRRPTYKQDWPAYNLAQTTEKHRFQELLADLCRGIEQPQRKPGRGRPRTLLADMAFSAAFKVYSTVSTRRFNCDLQDATARGYLSQAIHCNSVSQFLENADLTPVLHGLIVQSSLPLKAVETTFAPDSTGFSTGRFVRWYDEKYGVHRSGHDWVKVHVMTGTKTNVVTAAVIADRDAGDSPQFPELLHATGKTFRVKEVAADKAYLSNDNLELVTSGGGTAFVPFKVNSTQGEAGSVWERMFFYFQFRRKEFLSHYHQRSNVEATFSAIKRKFGDYIRSRTDVAMKNEALCKLLCHNICCVIHAHCELGIEPIFWPEQAAERPDVLPMARGG